MAEIPVYLFTGFLDAGKTTFIQGTLEDKRFNNGERTLVLQCEEGECELDVSRYPHKNVFTEILDDPESLTAENLTALQKKHKAQRVMIEYNGMWPMATLFAAIPKNWVIYQEMCFADAGTFAAYNANMRNLVVDKLQNPELVVFNRSSRTMDKMALHKIVRGVSRRVEIAYEYGEDDVEFDDIQDPLPFDKNAAVITVEDRDYALWYRDLSEELNSYEGKTVCFKGQVVMDRTVPKGCFLIGRPIMTCCVEDIRFAGLACEGADCSALSNRDWITVRAKISIKEHPCYNQIGPVLTAISVEKAPPPADEVATFY